MFVKKALYEAALSELRMTRIKLEIRTWILRASLAVNVAGGVALILGLVR